MRAEDVELGGEVALFVTEMAHRRRKFAHVAPNVTSNELMVKRCDTPRCLALLLHATFTALTVFARSSFELPAEHFSRLWTRRCCCHIHMGPGFSFSRVAVP